MQFHPLLKMDIDPTSIFIDRGKLKDNKVTQIQYKGDSSEKVDLVFIAEGIRLTIRINSVADAKKFTESLFQTPPYTTQRENFNVWAVNLISEDRGTDISGKGIYKNTALNSGYYTFGVDRYLTTPDMKSIRDAVWNVPCDAIFLLVNTDTYGGGGMYNFYAMGTADNERTQHVFVHEFGHSFAGLADEYFSSEVCLSGFLQSEIRTLGAQYHHIGRFRQQMERPFACPNSGTHPIGRCSIKTNPVYLKEAVTYPKVSIARWTIV